MLDSECATCDASRLQHVCMIRLCLVKGQRGSSLDAAASSRLPPTVSGRDCKSVEPKLPDLDGMKRTRDFTNVHESSTLSLLGLGAMLLLRPLKAAIRTLVIARRPPCNYGAMGWPSAELRATDACLSVGHAVGCNSSARSSVGQSSGFLNRRSQVRILPGAFSPLAIRRRASIEPRRAPPHTLH